MCQFVGFTCAGSWILLPLDGAMPPKPAKLNVSWLRLYTYWAFSFAMSLFLCDV